MRSGRMVAALALGFATLPLGGCGPASSTTGAGPDGIRTFTWAHDVLCTAAAAARPVAGVLRGRQGAQESVWIEDSAARHLSVLWPAGFSVVFLPGAELRDEQATPVARDGDAITLGQTNLDTASGSFDDPYIASGLSTRTGCYPFVGR